MMLGDKISAAEAERMGMIYACFEENEFYGKGTFDCCNIGKTCQQLH